ncbi:General odorant-binding protein 99b [Pseudolycoriella hygida]|uniref:General odorant-binding protein 99b n=1 Tax=Pseudolycoriella hygida TaxID=35572 RepID=A0A9Q0N537_9DIPT|nr:General odorant-binding protein 99b [Pseudolycoriella hygida]
MKIVVFILSAVVLVSSEEGYVIKTRDDVADSFRHCLTTLHVSRETFKSTNWNLHADNDLVRSMIKCIVADFGLFDDSTGFHKNRMVKQFGGETVRVKVEKCIQDNPNGEPTVDKSVQKIRCIAM